MALGLAIALAPWVANETTNQAAVINAAVAGFALMMLAELDLVCFRRWVVLGQLACGVWVATSALIFGYAGSGGLRIWHLLAGAVVILVGALGFCQHRRGQDTTDRPKHEAVSRIDIEHQT